MDPDLAKRLLETGATFILLDFPVGSEFGIDMNVYRVGEKFKGVKMIPPGLHFIYYSAVSNYDKSTAAPRSGFFVFLQEKQMLVKKWSELNEDLSEEEVCPEEVERFRVNLKGSLDPFLGSYDFQTFDTWVGLTDYISEDILKTLNPENGRISSVTQLIPNEFKSSRQNQKTVEAPATEEDMLPKMNVEPTTIIHFSEIPKKRFPDGASGSEITKYNIDSSYLLDTLISRYSHSNGILGEFQFAFVTFLVGHKYDSFEHWRAILKVFCTSSNALIKHKELFCSFIRVLHFQLKEVSTDLFVDIVENNNFLLHNLREFFSNLKLTEGIDESLKRRGMKFKDNLTSKYKWDFDAEPDDEAPVIVQC